MQGRGSVRAPVYMAQGPYYGPLPPWAIGTPAGAPPPPRWVQVPPPPPGWQGPPPPVWVQVPPPTFGMPPPYGMPPPGVAYGPAPLPGHWAVPVMGHPSMAQPADSSAVAGGGTSAAAAVRPSAEPPAQLPSDPFGTGEDGPGSGNAQAVDAPPASAQPAIAMPAASSPPPAPAAGASQPATAGGGPQGPQGRSARLADGPPTYAVSKKAMQDAAVRAEQRVQQVFPGLQPVLRAWLLHHLVVHYAKVPPEALAAGADGSIRLPPEDAVAACNSVAFGPAPQLAEAATQLLEGVKQRYLAGGDLLGAAAKPVDGGRANNTRGGHRILDALKTRASSLGQAVLEVLAEPGKALPVLPQGAAQGEGKRALPPPPPAPQRGSVVDVPDPLQPLFRGGPGSAGLLQQLLRGALDRLDASAALATGQPDASGHQLPLRVSPDLDFGTQAVLRLEAEQMMHAASTVAAGLPAAASAGAAGYAASAAAAGSLLDLLHLSCVQPQCRPQRSAGTGAPPDEAPAAGPAGSVLHFRQLVVENTSPADALWLLGGVAAPAFPHTLAAVDDARLFWLEGHKAVRLDPLQQHTISIALSSADCTARRQERGILQQLVLLVFAAPPHSLTAQMLGELEGVPVEDLPADPGGASAPDEPAAPAAPFRLFVVARRVTVALVDRPADLAVLLSVDAKPFVAGESSQLAEHLRRLFDTPPDGASLINGLPVSAFDLVSCGRQAAEHHMPFTPQLKHLCCAQEQKGQATCRPTPAIAAEVLLLRYSRLLALEEAAMEQDVCRYDMFGVRLRLAVFSGGTTSRYRTTNLGGAKRGSAAVPGEDAKATAGYRGPAVEQLQPGGVAGSPGAAVYALGLLDVPGLPEGRPALCLGDTVYLRSSQQPQREIAALVAAIDGSTVFLLLPPRFWELADVKPLVPHLATQRAFGSTGLFDGLVNVRFSFDRLAFHRMHRALAAVGRQQQDQHACWLPQGEPVSASGATGGSQGSVPAARPLAPAEQQRLERLQPKAEAVAGVAAAMQERGRQRPLNAEQRQAVAAVVCGGGRAGPYALFGPPGTGKTVTLVECALQLLQTFDHARLLLCAPQNYSADLLCSALAEAGLGPGELMRLNDPRRPPFTAKEDVLRYCCYDEATRMFALPSLADVAATRVVVATCGAAALMREGEFAGVITFTHVLIDEAGQALLPEAAVPLALLVPPGAAGGAGDPGWGAVLCGDPRQLGPVVRSRTAAAAGLATSLLELCISHHSAAAAEVMKQGRVPATSMLVRNYRSHRRLLDLPSRLFYQGSLLPAADQRAVLPPRWRELQDEEVEVEEEAVPSSTTAQAVPGALDSQASPKYAGGAAQDEADEGWAVVEQLEDAKAEEEEKQAEEQAVEEEEQEEEEEEVEEVEEEEEEEEEAAASLASMLFYGVRGQQMREGDAPSWFNPVEASVVVELVTGLLQAAPGVKPDDIGIMATYRKQVQKIRLLLRQRGLGSIRVGTVDDYQGQEERCIFISTTLSKPESLPPAQPTVAGAADAHLGFWRSPKRFNVAVTRAKALLVVVGHPAVLLQDDCWRELLRHCFASGAFRGAGSDTIRQRFRFDPGAAAGALPELGRGDDAEAAVPELEDAELQRAIGQLAELALLGGGSAEAMFPHSLDEMYEAALDEAPFRVVL